MISNNYFIMLWNEFTKLDGKFKLTPNELYLWCYLYTLRMYDDTIMINVELLHQCMELKMYSSRSHINKLTIKNILLELKLKCVVKFDVDDKKFMNDDSVLLKITIQCWNEKDKLRFNKDEDLVGFEMINYTELYNVKDVVDFYVYASVKRFDEIGGRDCSDDEWSLLLGVSESTVRRRINKLVDSGVIYKRSGKYECDKKQGKNTYKTVPFVDELVVVKMVENEKVDDKIDYGNWNDKKQFLNEDDFYLYWKYRDNTEFAKLCDSRLKLLDGKRDFTDWMNDGKSRLDRENKQVEVNNLKMREMEIVNAVVVNDEIVHLSKSNFDSVKWESVNKIYYHQCDEDVWTVDKGDFDKFVDPDGNCNDEQFKKAIKEYRKIVVKGEKLTIDDVKRIRETVKK